MPGIPRDAVAACAVVASGVVRTVDLGRGRRAHVRRDRVAAASTPTRTGRQRRARAARAAGLPLRRAARAGRLEAARSSPSSSTASARASAARPSPRRTRAPTVAACCIAPDARLDDGLLDVVLTQASGRAALPAHAAEGVQGHPRRRSAGDGAARRRGADRCRPARSPSTPTATRSPSCRRPSAPSPAPCACCCPYERAATRSRRGPRRAARCRARAGRGGTSLPGKVLMRLDPHAIGRLGRAPARRQRGRSRPPTARPRPRRWPRRSSSAPARGWCTTAPARTWPAGSPRRCWRPPAQRRDRGDPGLFEVDEFWLGQIADELRPRALLLGNLFRDQLDRYGELETIADRWARGRAPRRRRRPGAQRRRPDDRRPRPRPRRRPLLRRRGRRRGAGRDAARRRRQALPALRRALRLRRDLPRPPRPLPLPDAATRGAPTPRSSARDIVLEGVRGARFALHTPDGRARRRAAAARPLQRLQRARRRRAVAGARRVARRRRRRPARGRPRLRARRDRARGRGRAVDPAGQEPGRGQRGAAHARARARRARRAGRPQRQHRRRARRQLGVGRRLRGPRRPRAARDVRGHPRRRDGAAPEVRGRGTGAHRASCPSSTRALDASLAGARGALFALPTYTAMLALRELLVRRGAVRGSFA